MVTKMIRQVVAQRHSCITALLAETDNTCATGLHITQQSPWCFLFYTFCFLLLDFSHYILRLLLSLCPSVFDYTIPVNPVYLHLTRIPQFFQFQTGQHNCIQEFVEVSQKKELGLVSVKYLSAPPSVYRENKE